MIYVLKKISTLLVLAMLAVLIWAPISANAIDAPPGSGGISAFEDVENLAQGGIVSTDTGISGLAELFNRIQNVLGWVFAFALIIGVAMLIVGGIMYMVAGGNEERAGVGIKMVIFAVVGIVIAGLAWSIVAIVNSIVFAPA